jgi:hypothetical protein
MSRCSAVGVAVCLIYQLQANKKAHRTQYGIWRIFLDNLALRTKINIVADCNGS